MTLKHVWRYVRGLAVPLLLWGLFVAVLIEPLRFWLKGENRYDEAALREWIAETRVFRDTLIEMALEYRDALDRAQKNDFMPEDLFSLQLKKEKIQEHLRAMGSPTKTNSGVLLLFPVFYRLQVSFEPLPGPPPGEEYLHIDWDSGLPRHASQYQVLDYPVEDRAHITLQYQLHAYNQRQSNEQATDQRLRWVTVLAVAGTFVAAFWILLVQRREREHERRRMLARQEVDRAEHRRLEEELRRREAERRHQEAERKLLEQNLATQAAQSQALELKSQLYASIGIMAGSYAHNIKNLLVRPNDLLRRCMEAAGLSHQQEHMLHEVRDTLGTVTERLQQILRTVRRDPSRTELSRLDLNALAFDLLRTWEDLAREKWKLTLTVDCCREPLWVEGDLSHLQQAIENLLFNARDATFEMRNHLRDLAHRAPEMSDENRRQALIEAAAWRGTVAVKTFRHNGRAVLEVSDNGIGMTSEVRRRCTETHFSTKRANALYEGNTTGMGLGLSFVVVILEHHHARLDIESEPFQGAVFRADFPMMSG